MAAEGEDFVIHHFSNTPHALERIKKAEHFFQLKLALLNLGIKDIIIIIDIIHI